MTTFSGKYRLDARLGGGGMAEVFLGSTVGAEGFSRRVAIKRVLPGFSENPAFAKMFIDEARISSRLVHPNIVSVLDFDRDPEGRLYLVMELVEGRDLDGLAATGPLPVPVVIYVIGEVLRGLGHAHDLPVVEDALLTGSQTIRAMRGIVHRDVSPHNVLLSWEGAVKVSDFGIAKARSASSATASVFIKGKPAYMSPEQANGESLDGRSDLFAVGVMMWELLVGRRLFVGEDTRATLAAVLFGQIPRPRSLRSDVPKDLERVTMKLLERELPARYPTAEAAIHDLLECHAAPKDGRELLKRTLAERFPAQAPVRHSVLSSRGGTPPHMAAQTGSVPTVPAHARVTYADGQVGRPTPGAAMPSLGQLRGAETGTLPPAYGQSGYAQPGYPQPGYPQPSATTPGVGYAGMQPAAIPVPPARKGRTAIIVAAVVAAAAVLFAVIATISRGEAPTAQTAAGSGSDVDGREVAGSADAPGSAATKEPAASGSAVTALASDAGVPDATAQVASEPADSADDDEAKKDAHGHRPSEKRMGRLQVRAFPVLTVYVDNRKIHDTPVDMKLPTGKHKLRLVNAETGKNETLTVTIDENKPTIIERN